MDNDADSAIGQFYCDLFTTGIYTFEAEAPYFQEQVLHVIWNEQLFGAPLRLASGETMEVIHPGVWNVESGPDFHDAVISIAGTIKRGDVEVHFRPEDWAKHHHQIDRDYGRVIVHVVWQCADGKTDDPPGIPLFDIHKHLNMPIQQVISQYDLLTYPYARKVAPGTYADVISTLDNDRLIALLQSFGVARILHKAERMAADIQRLGSETVVYRSLLEGLGYKSNRDAFLALADTVAIADLAAAPEATAAAILFGAAGLLPDPSRDAILPEHRDWVNAMWSLWWSKRKKYTVIQWRRSRSRPFNTPERRLLAGHLVLKRNDYRLGSRILQAVREAPEPVAVLPRLRSVFAIDAGGELERFLTFSTNTKTPAMLLGASRVNDLIVNLCLPYLFANAFLQHDIEACHAAKRLLVHMPKLQHNRRFEEAIHRFFVPPSRARELLVNAITQQGLMRLYEHVYQA